MSPFTYTNFYAHTHNHVQGRYTVLSHSTLFLISPTHFHIHTLSVLITGTRPSLLPTNSINFHCQLSYFFSCESFCTPCIIMSCFFLVLSRERRPVVIPWSLYLSCWCPVGSFYPSCFFFEQWVLCVLYCLIMHSDKLHLKGVKGYYVMQLTITNNVLKGNW